MEMTILIQEEFFVYFFLHAWNYLPDITIFHVLITKHICNCLNDKSTTTVLLIHNYETTHLVMVVCDQFIICLNLFKYVVMIIYFDLF